MSVSLIQILIRRQYRVVLAIHLADPAIYYERSVKI